MQLRSKWGPERLWFCWRSGSPGSRSQDRVEHGECLLKSAVKINTCGRKEGSAGSRMVLPICPYQGWNDQAFHLLLPSISPLLWTSSVKAVVLQLGRYVKALTPKGHLSPLHSQQRWYQFSTEVSSGQALQCSPLILTSYFKEVETQEQKVVS